MNVLILINSFSHGGAETMSYRLAEFLVSKSVNVFVGSTGTYNFDVENLIINGLNNRGIKTFVRNKKSGRLSFVRFLHKFCKTKHIDIIHTNCKSPNYYGRLAVFFYKNVKIVTTIHNDSSGKYIDELLFKKRTDTYVAISERVFNFCVSTLKINAKKIVTIHNGITLFPIEKHSPNECFTVLSIGRIYKVKNYIDMAENMAKLMENHSDIKWIVVGSYEYDFNYFCQIKNIMGQHVEKVEFVGEYRNPFPFYNQSDCFLSMSHNEGFGLSIVEAIYAGIPTLTTDVGIVGELIKQGVKVEIINKDNALTSLEAVYQRWKEEKINFCDTNSMIISANYSNEKMCENYLNLYNKLTK